MLRGMTLRKALSNGRGTFVAAGGILGVGLYGFVATFQPYASGRVLEPVRLIEVPLVAAWTGPLDVFPSPPDGEVPAAAAVEPIEDPPSLPARVMLAPAPSEPVTPPPVAAAGGDGGVTPLPLVPEQKPSGIGSVIVDPPANPMHTGWGGTKPSSSPGAPPAVHRIPTSGDAADEDEDDHEPPATPSARDGEGDGHGKDAGKKDGKATAKGHAK